MFTVGFCTEHVHPEHFHFMKWCSHFSGLWAVGPHNSIRWVVISIITGLINVGRGLLYFHRWKILKVIQYYYVLFLDPLGKSLISDFGKEMKSNQAYYVFEELAFLLRNISAIRFIMFLALFSSQNNALTENITCCCYICHYKAIIKLWKHVFMPEIKTSTPEKHMTLHLNFIQSLNLQKYKIFHKIFQKSHKIF